MRGLKYWSDSSCDGSGSVMYSCACVCVPVHVVSQLMEKLPSRVGAMQAACYAGYECLCS